MVWNRYISHYNVYIDPHFFLGRNIGYLMRSLAHPSLKNGKNRIFKSMHHTNYNRNKISKNEVDSLVLYYLNNWCVYLRKRGPTLRELRGFKVVCSPPQRVSKIVILIHFMTMHIYKEVHVLCHQDHALCGKGGSNWYTV